jgi:transposase InsO family protein
MDVGAFVVRAHLNEGRPVAALAAEHGVSKSWIYKLLARYRREGEAGLLPHSKRPKRSPTKIRDLFEDEIVTLRKELLDLGVDGGVETIQHHLAGRHAVVPSVPTIWRVLRDRGFVTAQPHKRPRSSYVRFAAELPNQCWQADVTHVELADGTVMEVLNIIDDHSRLCVAARAFRSVRSVDVVRTLHVAAARWGYPAAFLSDNGAVFTASARGGVAALETELLALGIEAKHSRPYHPQTCGKIERFHQSEKKFLSRQAPQTKKQLQGDLDRFGAYYNEVRPHRAVNRRTPLQAFNARTKAYPIQPKLVVDGYRIRRDKVSKGGGVTLRYKGVLRRIGVGRQFAGQRVLMLVAGRRVRVLDAKTHQLIRTVLIDPATIYQRLP